MINIERIKVETDIKSLNVGEYNAFLCGDALDERTKKIINEITVMPRYVIKYNKESYTLNVNETIYNIFKFHNFFIDNNIEYLLIDSTSLSFPEILYILDAIARTGREVVCKIVYVEPAEYTKESTTETDAEFKLSDHRHPFVALPAFGVDNQSVSGNKAVLIPFLGFENSRLGHILENDDGASFGKLIAHVSVPAYKAGWENTSLKKHMRYLKGIEAELKVYPGSNPYSVNELLVELSYIHNKIVITPLGTKPTVIGICIFLVNNTGYNKIDKQVGAIYDFPEKSQGRSSGIGAIYTYLLNFN
ncbi:hypothetical protein [Erwinia sp. 198]|uniref:hypothetical protein n=1 Tax=Erwinia sp. 198 TaxID=2022746 RepID=UPI000F664036|nr:hypothetical protein [Erwinia sp. 198]RRZ86994.1 hypothetical protein EGK14_20060 [Erwinia sp. 198]